MRFAASAIVAAFLGASAAAAQGPADWEPAGKWEVNFADQQCLAFRPYKRGNETAQIALEAVPAAKGLTLYLIMPPSSLERWVNASVDVGGQRSSAGSLSDFSMGDKKLSAAVSTLSAEEAARLEAGEALGIAANGRQMHMSLTALPRVRKHLANCVSDLLKTWGYPLDRQQKIASFPEVEGGALPRFFRPEDYPDAAIRQNAAGRVRALFEVGADGKAGNCRIILSSRNKDLDDATCRVIVDRAQFTPAKDVSGQPVEAPSLATIVWTMP